MSDHIRMSDGRRIPSFDMVREAEHLVATGQVIDALGNETDYLVAARTVSLAAGACCCSCPAPQPCVHVTAARVHRIEVQDARHAREVDRARVVAAREQHARDRAARRDRCWRNVRFAVGGVVACVGLLVMAAADRGLVTLTGGAAFITGGLLVVRADQVVRWVNGLLDRPREATR